MLAVPLIINEPLNENIAIDGTLKDLNKSSPSR